jgi:hypothetical protein
VVNGRVVYDGHSDVQNMYVVKERERSIPCKNNSKCNLQALTHIDTEAS